MTKNEIDFETWMDVIRVHVLDGAGVNFTEEDSVRDDYESGRDVYDVIDEIVAEYGE